jgi:putative oxidoreductase
MPRKGPVVLNILLVFLPRLLLVMLFLPFSSLDKILNFKTAVRQASQVVTSPMLATLLIVCGCCLEVVMSLAILTGIADRLAAFILAGYCVVTAVLWKQFWKKSDFRLQGKSQGRELFWDFLKNVSIAGGFFLLAFGTNQNDIRNFFADPFASSHPYEFIDRSES